MVNNRLAVKKTKQNTLPFNNDISPQHKKLSIISLTFVFDHSQAEQLSVAVSPIFVTLALQVSAPVPFVITYSAVVLSLSRLSEVVFILIC